MKKSGIFRKKPPMSHFLSIKRKLFRYVETIREVELAGMERYVQKLNSIGHNVKVIKMTGIEMQKFRIK